MEYSIELLTRNLERRIVLFDPDERVLPDRQFIDKSTLWNPEHFLSKVILAGEISVIKTDELPAIVQEFEAKHNLTVSLDSLYDKFWLRSVMGYVEIPTTILYAVSRFEDIKDHIKELTFLKQISITDDLKVSKELFDEKLVKFSVSEKIQIDFNADQLKYFINKEGDMYKLSHPAYYEHFVDFEKDFIFLNHLKAKMSYGNQPICLIEKKKFFEVWTSHKAEYPRTPEVDELIKERVLENHSGMFQVTGRDYWEYFGNQSASALLEAFGEDSDFEKWTMSMLTQGWMRDFHLFIFSENKRQQLLEFLVKKIIDDSDLVPFGHEISKARLDCTRDLVSLKPQAFFNPSLVMDAKDSLYERQYKMDRIAEDSNSNLLTIQDSRDNVSLIIRIVLANDGYYHNTDYYFTKRLLDIGLERPFVLYTVCENMIRNFYQLIPSLLNDLKYSVLGLYLIGQVRVSAKLIATTKEETRAKEEVLTGLWADSYEIFCQKISRDLLRPVADPVMVGTAVYECLLLLTRWKFELNRHGHKYQKQFWASDHLTVSVEKLYALFLSSSESHSISELIYARIESIVPENRVNGVVALPIVKLDLFATFIRFVKQQEFLKKAIKSFGNLVDETFNKPYISFTTKPILGSHKQLTNTRWGRTLPILKNHISLNLLLIKPEFSIPADALKKNIESSDLLRYNESIRFQVERIRAYFLFISHTYREISSLDLDRSILKIFEIFYADLIERFSYDNFSSDQINILHTDFESGYGLDRPKLLPEVVYDLNSFKDSDGRKKIIEVFANRLSFNQLIEVWYFLSSEGDKKLLVNKIKAIGLERLLKESRWLPDIELALRIIGWSNLFENELTSVVQKLQTSKNKNFNAIIFQLQLYEFYHKNDYLAIRSLEIPTDRDFGASSEDFLAEKRLMEALVLYRLKQYDNALSILRQLNSRRKKLVYSLNIFASMLGKGEEEANLSDKYSLVREALSYWKDEKKTLKLEDFDELGVVSWFNELTAYNIIEKYEEFDSTYSQIAAPYKLTSLLLRVRIDNLAKQGRETEIDQLLLVANDYHRQHDGRLPEFLIALNNEATSPAQIKRLQTSFLQILAKSPKDLIQIIPEKINPSKDTLSTFLTSEIEYCLLEMLKRIRSITEIKKETKFNDLFASVLQARISMLDWIIKDNSTANKSGNGPDSGERDIVIQSNKEEIAIIECLHVNGRSKKYVWDHLTKIFEYSSLSLPKFVIFYYKGSQPNFKKSWDKYKKEVFPKTPFKPQFAPKSKSITKLRSPSRNMFVGKSVHHEEDLIHVYINLSI